MGQSCFDRVIPDIINLVPIFDFCSDNVIIGFSLPKLPLTILLSINLIGRE